MMMMIIVVVIIIIKDFCEKRRIFTPENYEKKSLFLPNGKRKGFEIKAKISKQKTKNQVQD